ncbi:hypothetical protein O9H85_10510 [Paenibacillus filicis]|uniref:Group II intron maturase-specific domain-containing protein n=1 Tax=Paenibacillus gyeongsangnamensis TaxID=3388067 RepID=A0ABT4Q7J9_9BACL|nr:group II intron maturase-specific domain-containing protein [Paenibacillus filicis]MCZ8512839.1 hypothetical protein [Paenibacillus filicis]
MNAKRLTTPKENVQQLQEKLGHAAKENKKRRFHALYDKVYRMDILWEAWRRVRANKGSAGIDGETLADIEKQGEYLFLYECHRILKEGKYHPQPVRRHYIPKKNGKQRPLGIPTIRDRVIQMATKMVMEPIFEAVNPKIQGWRNYYYTAHSQVKLAKLDWYILQRLTRWYVKKRQHARWMSSLQEVRFLASQYGLKTLL